MRSHRGFIALHLSVAVFVLATAFAPCLANDNSSSALILKASDAIDIWTPPGAGLLDDTRATSDNTIRHRSPELFPQLIGWTEYSFESNGPHSPSMLTGNTWISPVALPMM